LQSFLPAPIPTSNPPLSCSGFSRLHTPTHTRLFVLALGFFSTFGFHCSCSRSRWWPLFYVLFRRLPK
jgi:hypothetical protein